MKKLLLLPTLLLSFAAISQKIRVSDFYFENTGLVKGIVTKGTIPTLRLDMIAMAFPVSTKQKAALDAKADKTSLNILGSSFSVFKTNQLNSNAEYLKSIKKLEDSLRIYKRMIDETVINVNYVYRMASSLSNMVTDTTVANQLKIITLELQNKEDKVPYTWLSSQFKGGTDSTNRLKVTIGEEMTEAERLAIKDPPHGLTVIQSDGADPGTWGYNKVTGWKFLY